MIKVNLITTALCNIAETDLDSLHNAHMQHASAFHTSSHALHFQGWESCDPHSSIFNKGHFAGVWFLSPSQKVVFYMHWRQQMGPRHPYSLASVCRLDPDASSPSVLSSWTQRKQLGATARPLEHVYYPKGWETWRTLSPTIPPPSQNQICISTLTLSSKSFKNGTSAPLIGLS